MRPSPYPRLIRPPPHAVRHPPRERLQKQLRASLLVSEPLDRALRVLPEVLLEGRQQFRDEQAAVLADIPTGLQQERRLDVAGELARDDFAVDGTGDGDR